MKPTGKRILMLLMLAAWCAQALSACTVAPKGKTIVLNRPAPSPTATPAPSGALTFQLDSASTIRLDQFDETGFYAGGSQHVFGWLDNDHLAAVGLKPSAALSEGTEQPNSTHGPVGEKLPARDMIGARGMTGQVLSVDWQTGEAIELHTVRDEIITALGLDNDRARLWYTSFDNEGNSKLSVSDISFTHELLEVPDYSGVRPVWSSHDKYLAYLQYQKKTAVLALFDGVSTRSVPVEMVPYYTDQLYIDDSTDQILTIVKEQLLLTIPIPEDEKTPALSQEMRRMPMAIPMETLVGKGPRLQWVDSEYVLFTGTDRRGRMLQVVSTSQDGSRERYDNVFNFALSDDRKYICLARESANGTSDVLVAEWDDGRIVNEKLVFKGFAATGSIFFSPDNSKLYFEGSYAYAEGRTVGMVLKFR